jgi:CheY-like chemotaxis protein
MPKARVFFVDDEKDLAPSVAVRYADFYATEAFTSPHEALSRFDESVAVVVADHRMPQMTGLELLAKLLSKYPTLAGSC